MSKKGTLYLMRHGRTQWNDMQLLQGTADIPLNDAGRDQAREARDLYRELEFDTVFCSPLVRARETCEILLEGRAVDIRFDERLHEICFGEYEGKDNGYFGTDEPMHSFFRDPENYQAPKGAETFDQLFQRVGAFYDECVRPRIERGERVLIVAHGAMNSALITLVRGRELKDFWSEGIENCRMKVIEFKEASET